MAYLFAARYGSEAILKRGTGSSVTLLRLTPVMVRTAAGVVATLYTDRTKAATLANPVSSDANGDLTFFADPGDYLLHAVIGGVEQTGVPIHLDIDPVEAAQDADLVGLATAASVSAESSARAAADAAAAAVDAAALASEAASRAAADSTKAPLDSPTFTGVASAPSFSATGKAGATATPLILGGGTASGAPTTGAHLKGELVMDDAGNLYRCTVAGTPGTWITVLSATFVPMQVAAPDDAVTHAWLDSSTTPPVFKVWDGAAWIDPALVYALVFGGS